MREQNDIICHKRDYRSPNGAGKKKKRDTRPGYGPYSRKNGAKARKNWP